MMSQMARWRRPRTHAADGSRRAFTVSVRRTWHASKSTNAVQVEGLKVTDVVVLIDREQGGAARMASNGLRLHSAFTLSFIIKTLLAHQLVTQDVADSVAAFIAANQTFCPSSSAAPPAAPPAKPKRWGMTLCPPFVILCCSFNLNIDLLKVSQSLQYLKNVSFFCWQ